MKILFDQGTPAPLRGWLVGHTVVTAYEKGWSNLQNGTLISSAEAEGFDLLVTTDKNLKYQQNLTERKIAIVVLLSTNWPKMKTIAKELAALIDATPSGGYVEIPV